MDHQGATSYLQQTHHHAQQSAFNVMDMIDSFFPSPPSAPHNPPAMEPPPPPHAQTLLFNFSMVKEKVQQLQPLLTMALSHSPSHAAVSGVAAVLQDLALAASSMVYAFQQLEPSLAAAAAAVTTTTANPNNNNNNSGGMPSQAINCAVVAADYNQETKYGGNEKIRLESAVAIASDIIELDVSELLAKYTHYCQVCGKGFKRDANLRMHMRAHGDEYKTPAALTNPVQKPDPGSSGLSLIRKYSCPHEGCRWNRKHAKFQPLKSVICVKNHYKRSHCPKMYVCNRCNRKEFSVLSDLRTHEKHCGDLRWLCSCGTTFSRKDKLVGHVALFTGHVPVDRNGVEIEIGGRQN